MKNRLLGIVDEFCVLLRIFLSLPVGNASCERAMRILKQVKTYIWANMQLLCLSDLALLSIENEVISSLNITTFGEIKNRRNERFLKRLFHAALPIFISFDPIRTIKIFVICVDCVLFKF